MDYKEEKIGGDGHVAIHDWAPVDLKGHHKNSEQIERDIDETRHSMDMILDNLTDRFSPRNLLDQFFDVFQKPENRKHVQDMLVSSGRKVGESFQQNPIPLLLIGLGSAWLLLGNKGKPSSDSGTILVKGGEEGIRERSQEKVENLKNKAQEKFSNLKESVTGKIENVKENLRSGSEQRRQQFEESKENISEKLRSGLEKGKGLSGQLQERMHGISEKRELWQHQASDTYNKASDRLLTTIKENPLAAGFAAAMVGIAAGILFPETKVEREVVGEQARDTFGKVQEKVGDTVERGKDVVKETAGVASEKAKQEGLAPDNLAQRGKEQIKDLFEKGKNVAQETAQTVKEKSQEKGINPGQFVKKDNVPESHLKEKPVTKENVEIKKESIEIPDSKAAFGSQRIDPKFRNDSKKNLNKGFDEDIPTP